MESNTINIKVSSFVFTNETGVGLVTSSKKPNGGSFTITTLAGKDERIDRNSPGFLFLKDFDPELAVPLKLQSTEELYDRMRELAGKRKEKEKGKGNRRIKSDILVDKLVQDTLKELL